MKVPDPIVLVPAIPAAVLSTGLLRVPEPNVFPPSYRAWSGAVIFVPPLSHAAARSTIAAAGRMRVSFMDLSPVKEGREKGSDPKMPLLRAERQRTHSTK